MIEVSSPAEAVIFRLKQPLTESLEKKSCALCWPVLPVMLKLESNSSVSLGVTVLDTYAERIAPIIAMLYRRALELLPDRGGLLAGAIRIHGES